MLLQLQPKHPGISLDFGCHAPGFRLVSRGRSNSAAPTPLQDFVRCLLVCEKTTLNPNLAFVLWIAFTVHLNYAQGGGNICAITVFIAWV